MEEWREIEGYPNYEISNMGNVKSLNYNHTNKPKLLKTIITNSGYYQVMLWKNGKSRVLLVHRLVALAFIPNVNNYECVNHKDENKQNNCVENLEWCTYKYNNNYNNKGKRIATSLKDNPIITKPVYQLDKYDNVINEFQSAVRAAEFIGCRASEINKVCLGTEGRKTTHGYKWRYKN